ncbi:MAG: hypothetical protein ACK5JL_02665 [Candidatus Kapaibacterium sp.]|jgi:hypothetical protein
MTEIAQWVANNGLAVVIVIAGGIAIWRTAGWLAVNAITPLKDAFIAHLNSIGIFMKATTESLELTAKSMDTISEQLKGIRKDIDTMSKREEVP